MAKFDYESVQKYNGYWIAVAADTQRSDRRPYFVNVYAMDPREYSNDAKMRDAYKDGFKTTQQAITWARGEIDRGDITFKPHDDYGNPIEESVNEGAWSNHGTEPSWDWDEDRMGNITITSPDGGTCFLQGDDAASLSAELEAADKFASNPQRYAWTIDTILGAYEDVCENQSVEEAKKKPAKAKKAKGIFRTGDNGVIFIPSNKIDPKKVAKTERALEKRYGKGFSSLSPKEKLARIRGKKKGKRVRESIMENDNMDGQLDEIISNAQLRDRSKFVIQGFFAGQWIDLNYCINKAEAEEEMRFRGTQYDCKLRMRPIAQSGIPTEAEDHGVGVEETSNGGRIAGLRAAKSLGMVKDNGDVGKLLAKMDAVEPALVAEATLYEAESNPLKLSRAELKRIDKVRKRRVKRGRGKATAKQRLAAKRNQKRAVRSQKKGSVKRAMKKVQAKRARLRGNK